MAELDRQVAASADNCRAAWNSSASSWVFDLGPADYVHVGYRGYYRNKAGGGMRFTNITIPEGSAITAAYFTMTCYVSRSNTTVNSKIHGEDADNAAQFSDLADYQGRPRTTAEVNWDSIPAWTLDTEYNSPDIKTIIQEIIDRAGWVGGSALVIFWDDHDGRSTSSDESNREGYSYGGSSTKCAKLHIEYTPPAAGGARSHGYIMG